MVASACTSISNKETSELEARRESGGGTFSLPSNMPVGLSIFHKINAMPMRSISVLCGGGFSNRIALEKFASLRSLVH